MSFMSTIGSFTGKSAAYAVEGTRLASAQFVDGAVEGYVSKTDELRAKREALRAEAGLAPTAPQRKLSANPVKA